MAEQSVTHSAFVIERSYPVTPERVFAAFTDPTIKRRWFVEGDSHEVEEFTMDFSVGGRDSVRYRFKEGTPFPGVALISESIYLDIVPDQRIVLTYTMAMGEKPFSASLATVELLPTGAGTDLLFTHQGAYLEGADGPQMREAGWRHLLEKLAMELA